MKSLFTSLLVAVSIFSFGQYPQAPGSTARTSTAATVDGNGKISGVVQDGDNSAPVEFATVALHDAATGKVVNGAVADDKGKFTITKVSDGMYNVVISFIGYETQTINGIKVEGKNNDINLGTVKLSTSSKVLSEVVVEGKKDLIEERVDRTIYNAENDATAKGGDATDVLKRVPLLSVDIDGNVSLRGSSNITVLINNKPSTIMASSVADALKQIPADQIKTVEVITSPSAKYDAEGSGGIINIVTKKNTLEGLTLNVDIGAGYRGSNLGLNGNYRKKKMGFSLGGWGRANYNINGNFENSSETTVPLNGGGEVTSLFTQRADTRSSGMFGNYNLGWDYDINSKNALTASVRFGVRNNYNYQDDLEMLRYRNSDPVSETISDTKTEDISGNVDMNFTYTHYFEKPQRELSVLALYSRNDRNNDIYNNYFDISDHSITERQRTINRGLNEETTIQVDYVTPVGTNHQVETGAKIIQRFVKSDYVRSQAVGSGDFTRVDDPNYTNQLNYSQNIASGYLSHTFTSKSGISLKSGLRYEYTVIDAFSRTEDNIEIADYPVVVPSLNVSKRLKSGKTIKASYNRRIQRPSIQFLNPAINTVDSTNFSFGNPTLDPEYTNNYEVGYSTFIKGTSLNFTGFYRNSNNSIQRVRTPINDDRGTTETTFKNIGHEDSYGASVFANVNVGKLTLSGGGDVYYAILDNDVPDPLQRSHNEGWVVSGRFFGGYSFEKGWGLQFFGFYRGKRVQLQGEQGGFGFYSMAVRKDFANKRGSVGLGLENFLAKSITIRSETKTTSIAQSGYNTMNNFGFRVNLSYRIGKMGFDNQPRRRRSINNDDLKDGEGGGDGGMGNNAGGGQQGGGFAGGQRGNGTAPARPAGANATQAATPAVDPAAVVNAAGTWSYTIESPQGGNGTLVIKKDGEVYSGTINSNRIQKETAVNNISVKGNEITFSYDVSFGGYTTTIAVKAVIDNNTMNGNMAVGQFGTFPMKATRGQ